MNMNISKLPNEIIYNIVASMENCRDILNFCIINTQNKEMCQKNAKYLIRKAIERKYPNFPIKDFLLQIENDILNVGKESAPFSYLNGNGIYQKEFDMMPDSRIGIYNRFKWTEIKDNLLYISKCIKNNELPDLLKILPFLESMWGFNLTSFYSTGDYTRIIDILNNYNDIHATESAKRKNFESLKKFNFDKLIDVFIRFNKYKWIPQEDYRRFNQPQFSFSGHIDNDENKYILSILCKILKGNKIINLNVKKSISEYLEERKQSESESDSEGEPEESESEESSDFFI